MQLSLVQKVGPAGIWDSSPLWMALRIRTGFYIHAHSMTLIRVAKELRTYKSLRKTNDGKFERRVHQTQTKYFVTITLDAEAHTFTGIGLSTTAQSIPELGTEDNSLLGRPVLASQDFI